MKLIGHILKIIGALCLFFFVLPAVISALIPVLGVIALVGVVIVAVVIVIKMMFGR